MLFGQTHQPDHATVLPLILSLGLLVDDAIVVVENIHRHYQLEHALAASGCHPEP